MKWISLLIVLMTVAACSRQDESTKGATELPGGENGRRIISTVPAATLNIVQIGGVNTLVGVSKYDLVSLPADKQNMPVVGDYEKINYEALLRLKPTVLIVQTSPEKIEPRLREVVEREKIELVNTKLDTLADLWQTVAMLGRVTGKEREAGEKIALARGQLKDIAEKVAARVKNRPKVLYVVGRDPVIVAGGKTFMEEVITAAGGINVGAEAGRGYPTINREVCLRLAPEVILIGQPGAPPEQADDPRVAEWLDLATPAAKSKRIYVLTDVNGQLATLAIAETVRQIAELLEPELFKRDAFGPAPVGEGK